MLAETMVMSLSYFHHNGFLESNDEQSLKVFTSGKSDGSVVNNRHCFSRGPEFVSQHSHQILTTSVILAPRNSMPSNVYYTKSSSK